MSEELKMVGFDTVMRAIAAQTTAWLEQATLPALGEHIAWAMLERGACTDSLSEVHRVGEPKKGDPYTTCGMPIPDPLRWLSLSPALIASAERNAADSESDGLKSCGFCAAGMLRLAQVAA